MKIPPVNWSVVLRRSMLMILALSMLIPAIAEAESKEYYEGQIEPWYGENFSFAQYCCWLPPKPKELRGILCIVLHPHGNTGVEFADLQPWLAMAAHYRCALFSLSFVDAADKTRNWSHVFEGSGRSLIAAVNEVANVSGVIELASSKIVIAGVCEAGQYAFGFSAYAPQRTAAFISIGGSMHEIQFAKQAASVPGLLVAAIDRGRYGFDNILDLFVEGQKHSASWLFDVESIKEYDNGHTSDALKNFLDVTLEHLQQFSGSTNFSEAGGVCSELGDVVWERRGVTSLPTDIMTVRLSNRMKDWLPYGNTNNPFLLLGDDLPSSDLSFVSMPLPSKGSAEPEHINAGTIRLTNDAAEQISESFWVRTNQVSAVDDVAVATAEKSLA